MTPTFDRLRILIALAVLRNTPVDQTHSSYILSLRASFLSSEAHLDFWKGLAQQLGKECIELRAALGKQQIRSFIDMHASSAQPAECSEYTVPSSLNSNNDVPSTKKKSKKKLDSTPEVEVVDTLQFLRRGIRSGQPFETMDTFLQLWSLSDRPGFPRNVFFTAVRDVCKAISSAFDDATRKRTNLRTLQVVQTTICTVVDKAVPLVSSWVTEEHDEAFSLLFDNLLELFINPVIPTFLLVSERNLSYMGNADFGGSPSASGLDPLSQPISADYVDGRVSILALLQITVSNIQLALCNTHKDSGEQDSHLSGSSTLLGHADLCVMIHSLILTIVRHLRDILREGDTTHKQKSTRRRRIKRLAVKDTFWYLCSTMHFLLDLQDRGLGLMIFDGAKRQKQRLELLRQTILDIMVDLVLYQDRKRALNFTEMYDHLRGETVSHSSNDSDVQMNYLVLDEVGYRMFLGLVERFLCMP